MKVTQCFNFGLFLVFVPVVVGNDETIAVNITYKLLFTHTKCKSHCLIIYGRVYDPKQTTKTQAFCVKGMYILLRIFDTLAQKSKLFASALSLGDVEYNTINDIAWIPEYKIPESYQEGIVSKLQTVNRQFLA